MPKLHRGRWNSADSLLATLASVNLWPDSTTRILIYGSIDDAMIDRFRELGLSVVAFDAENVSPRKSKVLNGQDAGCLATSELFCPSFSADGSFDLVFSVFKLNCVPNRSRFLAAIARFLRPDGVALLFYTKRSALIEPCIFLPLGTRVQGDAWLWVWALLGVRNAEQTKMSVVKVVRANRKYLDQARYPPTGEIRRACRQFFGVVGFADSADAKKPGWRSVLAALFSSAPLRRLSGIGRQAVVYCANPDPSALEAARLRGLTTATETG